MKINHIIAVGNLKLLQNFSLFIQFVLQMSFFFMYLMSVYSDYNGHNKAQVVINFNKLQIMRFRTQKVVSVLKA